MVERKRGRDRVFRERAGWRDVRIWEMNTLECSIGRWVAGKVEDGRSRGGGGRAG